MKPTVPADPHQSGYPERVEVDLDDFAAERGIAWEDEVLAARLRSRPAAHYGHGARR